jgi:hypothetical protein
MSNAKVIKMSPTAITVDVTRSDPQPIFNAFHWWYHNAREAGLSPSTECDMIEKIMRGEVGFLYYSTIGGTFAMMLNRDEKGNLDFDDDFDENVIKFMTARRKTNRAKKLSDKRRNMVWADIVDDQAKATETGTAMTEGHGAKPCQPVP